MTRSALKIILLTGLVIGLASCATPRVPRDQNNICSIFDTNPGWYDAVAKSARKWRAPISAQMAIVWKESSFIHDARPPRKYVAFGLIPWGRVSSAVGYSQALNGTWAWYLKDTGRSEYFADRTNFADAVDFVGWYMDKTKKINGISMGDVTTHYLNYHDGHGGYKRGTYRSKKWLIAAARKVGSQAERYARQIRSCGGDAV